MSKNTKRLGVAMSGAAVAMLLVAVTGCGRPLLSSAHKHVQQSSFNTHLEPVAQNTSKIVRVDVFGGSMAFGWKDPHNDSYIRRAFALRSRQTHIHYKYVNHAIPGFTAQWLNQRYPGAYMRYLNEDRPQVVVLSWGLENDISSSHHDSLQTFATVLHQEISAGVHHHAVVLIITPPVTKLLATADHKKVNQYIQREFQVGQSFHSPNVVDINVFSQMEQYMSVHHQTYRRYYGNAWHPNQAGHELAGSLLAGDLRQAFGLGAIMFRDHVSQAKTTPTTGI